jgi:hypothetical protein
MAMKKFTYLLKRNFSYVNSKRFNPISIGLDEKFSLLKYANLKG